MNESYKKIIENISHWHEHEIHDKISQILGYNTWEIGVARFRKNASSDPNARMLDLHLEFRCREDYEKCVATIVEICAIDA